MLVNGTFAGEMKQSRPRRVSFVFPLGGSAWMLAAALRLLLAAKRIESPPGSRFVLDTAVY